MKNIKLSYLSLLALLTVLWLVADGIVAAPYQFLTLRAALVNYTGIIAMGAMSVGIILALRLERIESFLGGLDKGYRLHKWLGITALVFGIGHWLWANAPKWLTGWGWMERRARAPRVEETDTVLKFLQSQRGLAESIGEWSFYAAVLLIALALFKRFPYRYFFKTHRLLALVYLLFVFHALVLMKFSYWTEIIGPLMLALMLGGSVAAVVSLTRQVGFGRRAVGVIEELLKHPDNRVLKVAIALKDRWPGHQAGQFVFLSFDRDEGPHPFTISSNWQNDGKMFFLIKDLGDYTGTLPDSLRVGDVVKVEGPYGRFAFDGKTARQIWVAGGIGITPFIARLQALAIKPDGKSVDLFYSTRSPDADFIGRVQQRADAAKVRLHVMVEARDGRLNADRIAHIVPEWQGADLWFCGPATFGKALRADFAAKGLAAENFHQELFDMR